MPWLTACNLFENIGIYQKFHPCTGKVLPLSGSSKAIGQIGQIFAGVQSHWREVAFGKSKLICYINSEKRLTTKHVKKPLNVRTGLLQIFHQTTNKTETAFLDTKRCAMLLRSAVTMTSR